MDIDTRVYSTKVGLKEDQEEVGNFEALMLGALFYEDEDLSLSSKNQLIERYGNLVEGGVITSNLDVLAYVYNPRKEETVLVHLGTAPQRMQTLDYINHSFFLEK